jgi:hypothetical protein
MNKYDPKPRPKGEVRLNQEKFDWIMDSHLWYDESHGGTRCEWCKIYILSGQALNIKFPGLCEENPFVKELIIKAQDQISMELSEE